MGFSLSGFDGRRKRRVNYVVMTVKQNTLNTLKAAKRNRQIVVNGATTRTPAGWVRGDVIEQVAGVSALRRLREARSEGIVVESRIAKGFAPLREYRLG